MPEPKNHVCRKYLNARGERVDPADQGGIGCPICYPPAGRVPDRPKEDNNA